MNKKGYMINDEIRIHDNGENEIRFRIGIWNYNEAVIDLSSESENMKKVIRDMVEKLFNGELVYEEDLKADILSEQEKMALCQLFEGLNEAKMVVTPEERLRGSSITDVLMGEYKDLGRVEDREEAGVRRFLFITDDKYSRETVMGLSKEMNINVTEMKKESVDRLRECDLTTKMDTLAYYEQMEPFNKEIEEYYGVIVCLRKPEVSLLRNLNRILIHNKKKGLISFIDGPFITAFGIKPPFSGCIECFEERILSKMEDHSAYEKFERFTFENKDKLNMNVGYIPLMNFLSNLCLSEAYLLSVLGTNKLQGRCLSMYIPSLEIQIQDLLKVPYCNACGAVSAVKFKDLNINSRRVVDDIWDQISNEERGLL